MINQPLARRTDPLTSYLAADKAKAFSGSHKERIIQSLKKLIQATAEEIAKDTGLTTEQVDRRVIELVRTNCIVVAKSYGVDFIQNGFRVLEIPMTDSQREDLIIQSAAMIEVAIHQRDTSKASKLSQLRSGLIRCRSNEQIKKMEIERGLV